MISVTLYSRKGCHLCELVEADLQSLYTQFPHLLEVIDIESDARLLELFDLEIPVVRIGPYLLKAPVSRLELEKALVAQSERERELEQASQPPAPAPRASLRTWTRADTFVSWFAKHYLAVFNFLVFIFVGLTFLAPGLKRVGADAPADLIYKAYGLMCHQLGYRSFFLFGEQPFYPRSQAGLEQYLTFSQATGLSEGSREDELAAARAYTGEMSPERKVGYKIALCQRDVSIYSAILLFGILFALSGRRFKPLPWFVWVLVGLIPIGLDGMSQIISQLPLGWFPYRESTPAIRVITGGLFGFTTAWFGYPVVEESMQETKQLMADKWERTHPAKPRDLS